MTENRTQVNIVGAGLAGLSAAIHLAYAGVGSRLISRQPSERAQSLLAEGGINAALDTMGEEDRPELHFRDTMKSGGEIADPESVKNLTENAPSLIDWLDGLGVPFNRRSGQILLRNFGGQKKKRTAFAQSSTGKALMTALIDEARKYEAAGLITRFSRHNFERFLIREEHCAGLVIRDRVTGEELQLAGPVLMASGGLNGLFPGQTTGTTANTADAAAILFSQGVRFSNLEMIQYHPTTLRIPDKRLLISEAARGEGGRLFVIRNGQKDYFMEKKYPELGNLMPRDVVSREEYFVLHDPECGGEVFLDCTGLSGDVWRRRLPDLREEVLYYTGRDPAHAPIPVEPGIHYFMGGIDVDSSHRTSVPGLYAAGECCSLYHGANRLGGNSTLGAIYGGKKAAETITDALTGRDGGSIRDYASKIQKAHIPGAGSADRADGAGEKCPETGAASSACEEGSEARPQVTAERRAEPLGEILERALGVVRTGDRLEAGLDELRNLLPDAQDDLERARIRLGMAMVASARFRKESRGAQYRQDYPDRDTAFRGTVIAERSDDRPDGVRIYLRKTPDTQKM